MRDTVPTTQGELIELLAVTTFDPLERLDQLRALRAATERVMAHEVRAARRQDTTWEVIGETMGITRQAAHERYSESTSTE